jgi:hypothetical protein
MTPNDEALARLTAQREAEGRAFSGDDAWKSAMGALEQKIKRGDLAPDELQRRLVKESAGSDIFYQGIADADEASWRKWRDSQPNRARRIEQSKR